MTTDNATRAKLTTIAYFPEQFFLENLAVRADGSILVTVLNHKQLWYVPAPATELPVDPVLVHTFEPLPVPAKIGSELGRMFDHGVTRTLCVLRICAAVLRDVTVLWPVLQPVHPTGRAPWQPPRRSPTVSR
jgi:hypothetical protein